MSPKVRRMSMTERGVYITLLSLCWLDGSLPSDLGELASEVRIPTRQFGRMWANGPLRECFEVMNGRLVNKRLAAEQDKQVAYRQRQANAASMRWDKLAISQPGASQKPANALRSPISDLQSPKEHVPRMPLVTRRRLDAAWEGPKGLYVPQRKHSDFIQLRNHPSAESELFTWYQEVADGWTGSPGADMLKFWTARYDEKWPAPVVSNRVPVWAQRAKTGQL